MSSVKLPFWCFPLPLFCCAVRLSLSGALCIFVYCGYVSAAGHVDREGLFPFCARPHSAGGPAGPARECGQPDVRQLGTPPLTPSPPSLRACPQGPGLVLHRGLQKGRGGRSAPDTLLLLGLVSLPAWGGGGGWQLRWHLPRRRGILRPPLWGC